MTPGRSSRTLRAVLLAGLILVASSTHSAAASVPEAAAADVQRLLDAQVRAIETGDRDAYMATVDPSADESFRKVLINSFDGLRSVPLADHRLSVRLTDSGDLAAGLDLARRHGAQAAFLPETRRSYRLGDYDDRAAVDSLWWTYVQRDGRWFVTADDDLASIGLDSARQLWDFGPVRALATPHFLVLTKADQTQRGEALAGIAEEAMERFQRTWRDPWLQRVPLVVPGSPEEARQLLRTSLDVGNFVAFVSYTPLREDGWSTTAPRIFAQEQNLAGEARPRQVEDMVHELTHAAAASLAGPFTPTWLHEGLAEHVRFASSGRRPAEPQSRTALPTGADFLTRDSRALGGAYSLSTSAVLFLSQNRGTDAPLEVFRRVGERRVVAGSPAYNVNQAFIAGVGQPLSDFERAWVGR